MATPDTDKTDKAKARRQQPAIASQGQHILVVEDEDDLQETLRYNLEHEGYRVSLAASGEQALEQVHDTSPDLVILDLMLPGLDGLSVCARIRQDPATQAIPIIMLTAKSEESDVVVGLKLGADEYVTKPFSPRVLLARIDAVLRRPSRAEHEDTQVEGAVEMIQRGALTIDSTRHRATISDDEVELTHTEFKTLRLLANRPGRVFSRQQIITGVHGTQVAVTDRSVDVMVVSIRRKLGDDQQWIETVRGVGYRFKE